MTPKSKKALNTYRNDEFVIYDADHLEGMVTQQSHELKESKTRDNSIANCLPDYLEEDLRNLFHKMTSKNPEGVNNLDSQYVSYQELGKEELILMGVLF